MSNVNTTLTSSWPPELPAEAGRDLVHGRAAAALQDQPVRGGAARARPPPAHHDPRLLHHLPAAAGRAHPHPQRKKSSPKKSRS